MNVKRTKIVIKPDIKRVVLRFFNTSIERSRRIINSVLSLNPTEVEKELERIFSEFGNRHRNLEDYLLQRFEQVEKYLPTQESLSNNYKMLIGSYFTMEYSVEAAALFNPSIVKHPDQTKLPEGSERFVLSLRATGEGHISSITFRTGVIDENMNVKLEDPSNFVTLPTVKSFSIYNKLVFKNKLYAQIFKSDFIQSIISDLNENFTIEELQRVIDNKLNTIAGNNDLELEIVEHITALLNSSYECSFSPDMEMSERLLFPYSPDESNGIEDARFVAFTDDNGDVTYYATYTAYDGKNILPKLLETTDFLNFKTSTLSGSEVINKGMALFPRKVNGKYVMLGRQDAESNFIMFSDNLYNWDSKEKILEPAYTWELLQIGNCGSPIETDKGWLVLTHGVGPIRKYSIGAFLLDLNDPTKVIGRLSEPILAPTETERAGYVPNVVYSCGGTLHNDNIIIPYAMSDYASSFATVELQEILNELI
ncbi:MAG: glycosidase [Chlorobi bacterium]|nr:glycosidase [Chlorobiota bacterium]